ncbi:hypothetical protein [Synechocystis sp. LKSZ1]|uniref:hypothetical protein n=1 Tax=Synechocystis sp. LKSZ1 TaxID=3144951 RepID=UPI00336C2A54
MKRLLSFALLLSALLPLLPASAQQITGGTSFNPKTRKTTVTLGGLTPYEKYELFIPSYRYRTKGKADACGILTVKADKYPLRGVGNGGWQRVEIPALWKWVFYWGDAAVDDSPANEPFCVNGQVTKGEYGTPWPPGEWTVWVGGGLVKFYDPPLGPEMANKEYAVVLAGNHEGTYSGRTKTKSLKASKCGTVSFNILEYWDGDLKTSMGESFQYVDGYQLRRSTGSVLYYFNPANLWDSAGSVCLKGKLYSPRP